MNTLHQQVTSILTLTLTWGSEVWWTRARHIVDAMNPTYRRFARLITSLPTHTRTDKPLWAASIPPLHLLLDQKSRNYGIRLLLLPTDHPNNTLFGATPPPQEGVGLGRMKSLLTEIMPETSRLDSDVGLSSSCRHPASRSPPGAKVKLPTGTPNDLGPSHQA